jgi:hypothetical protein
VFPTIVFSDKSMTNLIRICDRTEATNRKEESREPCMESNVEQLELLNIAMETHKVAELK